MEPLDELNAEIGRSIEASDYDAVNAILSESTGINRTINPSEPDINFWNHAGFYFLQNNMFQEAANLYQTLYSTQLREQKKGERLHKGMALHNLGIAILNLQRRPEAQNYITLAYIEDCITTGKNAVVKLGYKTLKNEFNVKEEILDGIYLCAISSDVYDEYPPMDPNIVLESFSKNQVKWVRQARDSSFINLNLDFYKDLLERSRSAKTNDEKKKTLESLSEALFAAIRDFTILPSVRTSKSEIDRIIRNYSDHSFLRDLGRYVLIECKNWSEPAGAPVLRDLIAKIEDHRCHSGILMSKSGITGEGIKDAKGTIRDAYKVKGISVIVINESDLDEIACGKNPISILENKYEEVKFM